jgi:hypothetical protein
VNLLGIDQVGEETAREVLVRVGLPLELLGIEPTHIVVVIRLDRLHRRVGLLALEDIFNIKI